MNEITVVIKPTHRNLQCEHEGGLEFLDFVHWANFFDQELPGVPYQAEYRIDPAGQYTVKESWCGLPRIHNDGDSYGLTVCFLPREWVGQRVSRRTLPV